VYGKEVCDLFTKGSHHRNISVLLLTRNIFHQGANCTDISLNAKYFVLLKKRQRQKSVSILSSPGLSRTQSEPSEAYRDATSQPHGYFILEFAQDTDDRLRFQTNVFPDEGPLTVYAPVKDEAQKVELS
jgi:hypothetical protein